MDNLLNNMQLDKQYVEQAKKDGTILNAIISSSEFGFNCLRKFLIPDDSNWNIPSVFTSLNISSHNRIPTTDARMLRRLVRDARSRGCDALRTIRDWQKVRRGEDKYIFPQILLYFL